jgi:hypothetical protein
MNKPANKKQINREPPANFPGYELADRAIRTWSTALVNQARIHNDNWAKIREGTLTVQELFSSAAQMLESNARTAMDLVVAPFRPETAQWLHFEIEVEGGAVKRMPPAARADLGKPFEQLTSKIVGLHGLGVPDDMRYLDGDQVLKVELQRGSSLRVAVQGRDYINEWLAARRPEPGAYDLAGIVVNAKAMSGPPLAIIVVRLDCKA